MKGMTMACDQSPSQRSVAIRNMRTRKLRNSRINNPPSSASHSQVLQRCQGADAAVFQDVVAVVLVIRLYLEQRIDVSGLPVMNRQPAKPGASCDEWIAMGHAQ